MSEVHLDVQMCRQCGGLCCQGHPGTWADPQRFAEIFFEGRPFRLKQLQHRLGELGLQLRDYSGVPVPAPRETETGCAQRTETGCAFTPGCRPCQCLALKPDIETLISGEIHCMLPGALTYKNIRQKWLHYWRIHGDALQK